MIDSSSSPDAITRFLDRALGEFVTLVTATEPMLTALDERSGDGDFGANLSGGLCRATAVAAAYERDAATGTTEVIGRGSWPALTEVFLDEVGGTSGPLLGLLFQNVQLIAPGTSDPADLIRDGAAAGLAAVQRVGEARVGQRTLVDALAPAVEALLADSDTLSTAADAAVDGAIATRDLLARMGRASYVGERAIGYPDPGAVGIALLFIAFARAAGENVDAALDRLLTSATTGLDTPAR